MSDALYERYKDALRRGHVAMSQGRSEDAVGAYREAIKVAPDRAMPYDSLGGVLVGLMRWSEALAAFDHALAIAPTDEVALRGRVEVLIATDRRVSAAETLDRLSAILDRQGRLPEACDAARQGLDLAESRDRRRDVEAFARRLRSDGRDAASIAALGRALEILREPASVPRGPASEEAVPTPEAARSGSNGVTGSAGLPSERVASGPVRPDLMAAAELAMDEGDFDAVRACCLAASNEQRGAGLLEAALDTCYLALAVIPSDPDIHLALAALYLDRGWRASAVDKVLLLGRLADLTDDAATHDRLAVLVAERLPDEPRLLERHG